jgi:cytochrome c-type biogenesis protein CcmE
MQHKRVKILVAVVVLGSALGLLGYAGVDRGWVYYLDVDAFVAQQGQHRGERIRLHGKVAEAGAQVKPAQLTARFDLVGQTGGQLSVVYKGVVPATFQPGGQVVVEGKLDAAGVFQADVLMTKCASKYQSEKHAELIAHGDEGAQKP